MTAADKRNILQTVNHQHAKNRGGQHLPQVLNILWRRSSCRKQQEGQKSGEHGTENHCSNGKYLLCQSYFSTPPFSNGLFKSVSRSRIPAIDGSMKLSAPKSTRHNREIPNPTKALV